MSVLNFKELFDGGYWFALEWADEDSIKVSSRDGKTVRIFRAEEIAEVDFAGCSVGLADLDMLARMPNLRRLALDIRLDEDMVDDRISRLPLDTLRVSGCLSRVPKWKKMFRVVETY